MKLTIDSNCEKAELVIDPKSDHLGIMVGTEHNEQFDFHLSPEEWDRLKAYVDNIIEQVVKLDDIKTYPIYNP